MRRWRMAALAAGLALCQVGCVGKFTGGGWLDSRAGNSAKATFGMNMQAIDEDGNGSVDSYRGQFEYQDKGALPLFPTGVRFHGEVTTADIIEDVALISLSFGGLSFDFGEGLRGDAVYFTGTYQPQPSSLGAGGQISGVIVDSGIPGETDPADFMAIALDGGVYGGYANGGFLQGGEIQFHPPDDEE